MKRQLLILLALGLAGFSYAQKNEAKKIKDIDEFLTRHEALNKFNGTVLVAQHDKILLKKGYGYSDFENKISNDSSGIFQIYSITKTFTSTMIFKLIEQGKLSLDDRLSKFYPSFPNGDNITIEHLLTHSSGINDYSESNTPETEEYRVLLYGKNKVNFASGVGWSYCNGGYQLLGYIIAKITMMPYEKAIRENIFNPLGMSKSGFDFKNLSNPDKVKAYHIFTNDKKETAVLYDSTGPFSAGSIYSTVGDLYKYYKSFKSHQILHEASQKIAFSPSKTNEGYGYGWQLYTDLYKSKVISHSGGAVGFRSNFAMVIDEDICIIILNNHENAKTEFLTRRILDILHNRSIESIKEAKLKATDLEKLVGAFSIKEPRSMIVHTSVLDGRLAIEVSGMEKTTVIAKNKNTFVKEEEEWILEFAANKKGIYSEFNIRQGSHTMVAKRIESCWGLIGSATPKGWDDYTPDIKFVEDKERKGLWLLKNITLKEGEMTFRLNNDWNLNYGDNKEDKMLDRHGEPIKIKPGVYNIILDLTDVALPHYTISKKE